jgi:ABC-2 type transport system permease protein
MTALVLRSLHRTIRPLAALAVLLIAFQLAVVAAGSAMAADRTIAGIARLVPSFLQPSLGVALLTFGGLTTIAFFDALVVMLFVQFAAYLASEPAGDVESGLVDLVLARSLPRHWLVTRTLLLMCGSVLALAAVMVLALGAALMMYGPAPDAWPSGRVVASMVAHLTLIAWCFGAIALAASGWARRRASVMTAVGIAAIGLYLVDFVATIWRPLRGVAVVSPFHYFRGGEILAGTANTTLDLAVLGGITIAATAVAYIAFRRRDL